MREMGQIRHGNVQADGTPLLWARQVYSCLNLHAKSVCDAVSSGMSKEEVSQLIASHNLSFEERQLDPRRRRLSLHDFI